MTDAVGQCEYQGKSNKIRTFRYRNMNLTEVFVLSAIIQDRFNILTLLVEQNYLLMPIRMNFPTVLFLIRVRRRKKHRQLLI